ncbi:transmembrane protease serine 11E [Patagioenas fasciata monilis]|uniref:Transmembrane protease serine 11E n=1 Tax=Patagioenas fasciata monilis TaxID=372326 RepID=A0A1V4JWI4_PATFA|nr:transmembrane protease serine 11E [Patagioenas fasciata monilis]
MFCLEFKMEVWEESCYWEIKPQVYAEMLHTVLWRWGQCISQTEELLADLSEILIQMDRATQRLEPWKIAVIVVAVIAGLALIIGLLTFYLCHDQDRYYNASFIITNVKYKPQYERQTTEEFRDLSEEIETMMSAVFKGSFLSKRYIRSHVVSLSPDPGGVLASVVLVFKFVSADSQATSLGHINRVLRIRLQTSSNSLNVDQSTLVITGKCLRVQDPRRWTASFGILLRPPKQKKYVRRIIVHEKYGNIVLDHQYDVAVVELASPIEFTSDVHSVCLPEASHIFPENTSCFVTGWGALENDGQSVNQLRQAEVKIISTEVCNGRAVYNGAITPGMLCAGYLEGKVDACQGDSGGPLVNVNSRGIWYLVGIVSWGDECGKRNKPGVYTRVTYYRDWIASKTGI